VTEKRRKYQAPTFENLAMSFFTNEDAICRYSWPTPACSQSSKARPVCFRRTSQSLLLVLLRLSGSGPVTACVYSCLSAEFTACAWNNGHSPRDDDKRKERKRNGGRSGGESRGRGRGGNGDDVISRLVCRSSKEPDC